MKRQKVFFLIVILSVILCGCGNKIEKGVVYDKEFVPAYTETVLIPIVSTNGKTTTTTLIPVTNSISEKWYISIQSQGEGEEYQKARYEVSEEIFNQYEVGDFYSHKKN